MEEKRKILLDELIFRMTKGDKSVYEILFKEFYRSFFYCILKIVGNVQTAEDLTQDLFFRLSKTEFDQKKTYTSSYLYAIAKNLCFDYCRRKKKEELVLKSISDNEKYFYMDYSDGFVFELFQGLTDDEEKFVKLRYKHGYSVKEIAQKLDYSERTLNRIFGTIKEKILKNSKVAIHE